MIHSIDHIETRLAAMQIILESDYDSDNASIVNDRITEIGRLMAESGTLKASADWHHRKKLNSDIMEAIKNLLPEYASATLQKKFVESLANDEARLATDAERVNRSCTHQLSSMVTQLSYLKTLMQKTY